MEDRQLRLKHEKVMVIWYMANHLMSRCGSRSPNILQVFDKYRQSRSNLSYLFKYAAKSLRHFRLSEISFSMIAAVSWKMSTTSIDIYTCRQQKLATKRICLSPHCHETYFGILR